MPDSDQTFRPLIVGEALFDRFPDSKQVLGGAPFNVAWNLRGLGIDPAFVSAVGTDEQGQEIRQRMEQFGLKTELLQISETLPTGQVRVELDGPQPTYHILDNQAYDDIRFTKDLESVDEYSLLYHGSLAFRGEPSRSTIKRLINDAGLPRFVDVNIRQPWFKREWLPDLFEDATWLKLNDDELSWITEMDCVNHDAIRKASEKLRNCYRIRNFFVTCGARGALAIDINGNVHVSSSPTPPRVLSTVGAGDAFSAATIFGISRQQPLHSILEFAVRFASHACTLQGATTDETDHYNGFVKEYTQS